MTTNGPNTQSAFLPCPFCGCEDIKSYDWGVDAYTNGWEAYHCEECECAGGGAATRDEAAMLWNTRAQASPPSLPSEPLREALEGVMALVPPSDLSSPLYLQAEKVLAALSAPVPAPVNTALPAGSALECAEQIAKEAMYYMTASGSRHLNEAKAAEIIQGYFAALTQPVTGPSAEEFEKDRQWEELLDAANKRANALAEALTMGRGHMLRLGMDSRHIDFDPIDAALAAHNATAPVHEIIRRKTPA